MLPEVIVIIMSLMGGCLSAHEKKVLHKIIMLGDPETGKTMLMNRYKDLDGIMNEKFDMEYKPTDGANVLTIEVKIDGKIVIQEIWDTAGQEELQTQTRHFYKGADACILVYDITDLKSFKNLEVWRDEFLAQAALRNPKTFPFIVIGNKVDLETQRRHVCEERVKQWCSKNGSNFKHLQCSAKNDVNVNSAFGAASRNVLKEEVMPAYKLDNDDGDASRSGTGVGALDSKDELFHQKTWVWGGVTVIVLSLLGYFVYGLPS